jgi:hypothetical protein
VRHTVRAAFLRCDSSPVIAAQIARVNAAIAVRSSTLFVRPHQALTRLVTGTESHVIHLN